MRITKLYAGVCSNSHHILSLMLELRTSGREYSENFFTFCSTWTLPPLYSVTYLMHLDKTTTSFVPASASSTASASERSSYTSKKGAPARRSSFAWRASPQSGVSGRRHSKCRSSTNDVNSVYTSRVNNKQLRTPAEWTTNSSDHQQSEQQTTPTTNRVNNKQLRTPAEWTTNSFHHQQSEQQTASTTNRVNKKQLRTSAEWTTNKYTAPTELNGVCWRPTQNGWLCTINKRMNQEAPIFVHTYTLKWYRRLPNFIEIIHVLHLKFQCQNSNRIHWQVHTCNQREISTRLYQTLLLWSI